jgi:MFS transporter, DHA1 family, staphyloferrin A biosynthesis exporter
LEEITTPITTEAPATGAVAAEAPFGFRAFAPLRYLDYRYLWAGTVLMSAGQWIQQVTLGWLLYDLTGSAVLLGALNGVRALPFLVAGPIAGVAADRMDRKKLLLRTQYLLIATALAMGVLVMSGYLKPWHLFVFTLFTGMAWAFNEPVRQSLVPGVVPKNELMSAVALNSMGFNINKVLGPALGGVLIAGFGAGGNFFVQSVAYAGVLYMIYRMHVPPTPDEARHASAIANLKEGLAYVWSNPTVLALMTAAYVPRIFAVPYQTLMPVFQKDVLGVGPEGLGLLMAAPGIGAVLSVLLLSSSTHGIKRKGLMLLWSLVFLGSFLILFSSVKSFPVALIVLVGVGACQITFMATTNTLLQMLTPDALRGRVMSLYMLDRGLMPVGALMAGVTAHVVGAPSTVAIMGGIVIVLALLVAWRVPRMRQIVV